MHKYHFHDQLLTRLLADIVGEQQKVGESKQEAERETKKYDEVRVDAINRIKDLEAQLDIVSNRVSRAQDVVDNIASLPPLPESTYFQDLREAQELNPNTPPSEIGTLLTSVFIYIFLQLTI